MGKMSQYLLILALLWMGSIDQGFAQPIPQELPNSNTESITEKTTKTKAMLQELFVQWRQAHSQEAMTASAFHGFVLSKRIPSALYGQTQYNAFKNSLYQPVYVLANGAWIMGFENKSPNSIGVWVDVNGGDAPGYRGSNDVFDQKELIFNAQGQVIQILN